MFFLTSLAIVCGNTKPSCLQNIQLYDKHGNLLSSASETVFPISVNDTPGTQVPFNMTTPVQLKDEASCFNLLYDFEGDGEKLATQWKLPKGKLDGTLRKYGTWKKNKKNEWDLLSNDPNVNVHLCQIINVQPMLRFKSCTSCPKISKQLNEKFYCDIDFQSFELMPVWNWLTKQDQKSYPKIEFVANEIVFHWGDATKFDCQSEEIETEISFEFNIVKNGGKEIVISGEQKANEWKTFENKKFSHNLGLDIVTCNSWKIQTKLQIIFGNQARKILTFERIISQRKRSEQCFSATDIALTVVPIVISVLTLMIISCLIIILIIKKKKQRRKTQNSIKVSKIKQAKANRVVHCIIIKNKDLLDNLEAFINILKHTKIHITKKETTYTAHEDVNLKRNRYSDMVPYDSNMTTLSTATGTPPSTYINASPIKFSGWSQEFLAVQAPRPNMFSSFWQMVDDQNLNIIVMITGLQEGTKIKAHQYWPDKNKKIAQLKNGIKVQFISQISQENYFHTNLVLENNQGSKRAIDLVQCSSWHDVSVPENTKILLDILYKTMELAETRPGPILVHCSAGVGRTGTFIGLYKLVNDFMNKAVKEIDFFETVVLMREQRMMMVHKPMQYYYMIRCLTDHVSANEIDYELIGIPSEEPEQEDNDAETPQTSETNNRFTAPRETGDFAVGGVAVSGNLTSAGDITLRGGDTHVNVENTTNLAVNMPVTIQLPKDVNLEAFAQYFKPSTIAPTDKDQDVEQQNYPPLL